MTRLELDSLANSIVAKLMPRIERAIDERIKQTANEKEDLLSQTQLAELLGVHPSTLHGKTDIYPHTMVGGRRRFFKSRVIEMLQTN